jgi:hypothetical protein
VANWSLSGEAPAGYRRRFSPSPWGARRAFAFLGLGFALVVFVGLFAGRANAAPVDCTTALDVPTCQNTRAAVIALEAIQAKLESGTTDVRVTGVNIPPGAFEERSAGELPVADGTLREMTDLDGETSVSTKVRLSSTDRQSLDFIGWGAWFAAGVLLCTLFATQWHRAWRWWSE